MSTGNFDSMIIKSGTSMAAPHVTAVAAAVWGINPEKTNDFVRELLIRTANTSIEGIRVLDAECAIEQYDTFSASYVENQDNYTIENVIPLVTYSDEAVEALWNRETHEGLPDTTEGSQLTPNQLAMLKVFSDLPDRTQITLQALENSDGGEEGVMANGIVFTNYFTKGTNLYLSNNSSFNTSNGTYNFRLNKLLHGSRNYVASLRYLLSVAEKLWNKKYYKQSGITRRKIIRNAIEESIVDSREQ